MFKDLVIDKNQSAGDHLVQWIVNVAVLSVGFNFFTLF